MFTVIFAVISFAATEDMPSAQAPGLGSTVTTTEYTPTPSPQSMDIDNGNVPAAGDLVSTGGVPAFVFYGAGGLCIAAALIIPRKKTKESSK